MSHHQCSVCKKEFKEEYFDIEQKKCIMHCNKSDTNDWYILEDEQKNWDNEKIKLFWWCIQEELERISDNNVDQDKEMILRLEYKHVVFPQHQKNHNYNPSYGHISDLATNFYIHYQYQNRDGNVVDIYNTFETLQLKFIDCTFLDIADFRRYTFKKDVFFFNCTFTNKILLGNTFSHRLSFKECNFTDNILYLNNKTFVDKVVIKQCHNIQDIDLKESIFESKFKLQFCDIKGVANFYNTKFMDLADFYQTKFNEVNFERTDFNQISIFSETQFNEDVDFKYTKFLGKSIFRDTIFIKKLNLRNTIFDDEANFLDITSEKDTIKNIQVANRETARVIKNFHDSANNIIEANKFYALEMKERAKELNILNFWDWLVFKFHGFSSNHSQDWSLVLLWIIFFTIWYINPLENGSFVYTMIPLQLATLCLVFASLLIGDAKLIKLYLVMSFLPIFYYSNITLNCIAEKFNTLLWEFKSIDLRHLIFKVILAYLIYQFIVSIRQNTRRS